MSIDPKILDRIQKCLALADAKGATPGESAAAYQMAQKLMAEYNVTLAGVRLADIQQSTKVRSVQSATKPKDWEVAIMDAIAKSFNGHVFWYSGRSDASTSAEMYGKYTFLARREHLPVMTYAAEVLLRRAQKARGEFLKPYKGAGLKRLQLAKLADSYCFGWASAVHKLILQFAEADPATVALVAERKRELVGDDDKGKPTRSSDGQTAAALEGYARGAKEQLHRPMDYAPQAKIRG